MSEPPDAPDASVEPAPATPVEPVETAPPLLRVVKGDPSPEELAALIAVLASVGGGPETPERRPPEWNAPRRLTRVTHRHGPGAWRASGLPR